MSTLKADFVTAPESWWINPEKIPLYTTYKWPVLAQHQEHVQEQRFKFEEFCGSHRAPGIPSKVLDGDTSVRAKIQNSPGDWSVQEQMYHLPGDTWTMGQTASSLMNALEEELRSCGKTNSGAEISSLNSISPGTVATITFANTGGPALALHEYLISPPSTGSVVELSLWVEGDPKIPWSAPSDNEVLDALAAGLCRKNYC